MGNCFIYSSKKSRNYFVLLNFSFTSTSSPWATYRHLTDICAWGWGIWTLLGEGGEVKSFQLNTNMEYVKGKQWLRRKGLRGFKVWPVYRDFHFHQKNWQGIWTQCLSQGVRIWTNLSSKIQSPGVGCWSFKLMK